MARLASSLAAVIAGWAISLPLQVGSYVLSPLEICAAYTPFVIAVGISAWNWRAPLAATALLAAFCVILLRLGEAPLLAVLWPLAKASMYTGVSQTSAARLFALWALAPALLTLMAAMASTLHPVFSKLRPASVAAGVTLGWWFLHTFTDFVYYLDDSIPLLVSVAAPLVGITALTPVQGRDTWASHIYGVLEPLLVVIIGWLAAVPFYKSSSPSMRLLDLHQHISVVAVPCVLAAIVLSLTKLLRKRRGSPPNSTAPAGQKAPLPGR